MGIPRTTLASRETTAFNNFARLLFSLILTSAVLVLLGFATASIYRPQPDTKYYGLLLYPGTPEPTERTVFLVVILAAPIASWLSWRVMSSVADWPSRMTRLLVLVSLTVVSAGEVLIVSRSEFLRLTAFPVLSSVYTRTLATAAGIALALYVLMRPRRYALRHRTPLGWITGSILVLLGLVHAASRIHTLSTLQVPGWGQIHFEAAFYSVSQVANGKTLLADLPAQYGLYAELLRPVLSGACTVLRFTTTMAILQFLGFLGILFVCKLVVRSRLLVLLAGFSLSVLIGEMWLFGIKSEDPYYQYWPLRLIFPSIAIVIFGVFLYRPLQPRLAFALLACTGALACIWNLDTGIPVCGATFAYLLSHVIVPPRGIDRRKATSLVVLTMAILVSVLAAFFAYLRLKAGRPLEWRQLLEYQKVFYSAGINLLPMPVSFHPWVLVGVVYIAAIVIYAGYLQRGFVDRFSSMLFYLSILGIGLFAYYQGRSHEYVFTIVIWPAVVIGFALLDRIRRICAAHLLPRASGLAAAPLVALATLLGWSSLLELPAVVRSISQNRPGVSTPSGAKLEDAILFIRKNSAQNRRAVILSSQQATYFGEAHLASAINGPGLIEIVFRSDMNRFYQDVVDARGVPVFVDLDGSGHVAPMWRWILNSYALAECSPLETIARITPTSNIPPMSPAHDVGCPHRGS